MGSLPKSFKCLLTCVWCPEAYAPGKERLFRLFMFPVLFTHFSQQSRVYSPFLPRQNRKRLHCLWAGAPLTCQLGATGSSTSCFMSPVLALVDSFNFFLTHLLSAVYCWRSLDPLFFPLQRAKWHSLQVFSSSEFLWWRCLLRCSLTFSPAARSPSFLYF